MESDKIRKLYLDFFQEREHVLVPSMSLIPLEDPTLLFTSAGMVQFKKYWATDIPLPYKRATSCQKCMRAGGKDSDLEKIGESGKHHTFFEMLGNFSFGDYFKKEAIKWAYEFTVNILRIPEKLLWVSYYERDKETEKIWREFLPQERIVPLGEKDNFWGPAGNTGPCGPCTELYIDLGINKGCGRKECKPGCDCERFLEFWNLVFPQYDKQDDGSFLPLKRKGVDTGMGLERIARILQKTETNYETDIFLPIIRKIEEISNHSYEKEHEKKKFFRIISDHIRSIVFVIDENVIPSNEGRGYVVRNLIRRACIAGINIGISSPFLHKIAYIPIQLMSKTYPTLSQHQQIIEKILYEEEDKFYLTANSSEKKFIEFIKTKNIKDKFIPGNLAFELYSTYGIRKDILEKIANSEGFKIDWETFNLCLLEEKERSRFTSTFTKNREIIFEIDNIKETEFIGYNNFSSNSQICALYRDKEKDLLYLVLDKTPFYPEKGGQIGDKGIIENTKIKINVVDTQIDEKGLIYHIGKLEKGLISELNIGMSVKASIDTERRKEISVNHTATHLLQYALRTFLGNEVRQSGSYVGDDKLRFDFICFSEINTETLNKIEKFVQEKIFENIEVIAEEILLEEAIKKGAVALFLDKYKEKVRVIHIDEEYAEVCGGTHLKSTGEIYLFKIINFTNIGKNMKRIESVTYKKAYNYIDSFYQTAEEIGQELGVSPDKIKLKIEKTKEELEEKEKLIRKYKDLLIKNKIENVSSIALKFLHNGEEYFFVGEEIEIQDREGIGKLADKLLEELKKGIVIVGSEIEGKVFFVIKVSKELSKVLPANKIIKDIFCKIKGKGGGSPIFSQGNIEEGNFTSIIETTKEILQIK